MMLRTSDSEERRQAPEPRGAAARVARLGCDVDYGS